MIDDPQGSLGQRSGTKLINIALLKNMNVYTEWDK